MLKKLNNGGEKVSYEYAKLSGRIREKMGSQRAFAKAMGLSERTISLKMQGKIDWRLEEIRKACAILSICPMDIHEYFFALVVQKVE